MSAPDYPLRFRPIYQERLWGGDWHLRVLGATVPEKAPIGESWELCDRPDANTRVAQGPLAGTALRDLIQTYPQAMLGPLGRPEDRFPLLIKFIGTREKLSLQVHPPDDYARDRHAGESGKTELWYVLAAETGAQVRIGFSRTQSLDAVRAAIREGRLEALLAASAVRPGEAFFVPAGRIHGIGAGVLAAEVQENSDLTYRVYDYDRTDETGQPRSLQIEPALAVLDLTGTPDSRVDATPRTEGGAVRRRLAADRHFQVEHLQLAGTWSGPEREGFQVLVVTEGDGELAHRHGIDRLTRGAVRLLPAGLKDWTLYPGAQGLGMLLVWIE